MKGKKMKKFILIAAIFAFAGFLSASPIQWKITDGGNGHWYEPISVSGGINWITARDTAVLMGGHLVTITSIAENNFVFSLITDRIYWGPWSDWGPWLGGYQVPDSKEPDEGWRWVTDEPFEFYGNPDNNTTAMPNYSEEAIHYAPTAHWNDLSDHLMVTNGFIVEYIPEPATLSLLTIGAIALLKSRRKA
jgi:hypothetical protein